MKYRQMILLVACANLLWACNNGGHDGNAHSVDTAPVPESPQKMEFSAYVADMIQHTDENDDPVEVNLDQLSFDDNENEAAFDALL